MKKKLLDYLACPQCRKQFRCFVDEMEGKEIVSGKLVCGKCNSSYPILRGVPRILPGLSSVERHTAAAFGYEWKHFKEHYGYYESQFLSWILPIKPDFFRGKVVLDAGCGMGRNLFYAAKYGAKEAIGLDLSESVDPAYQMTKDMANVHIVQGDIYNPPFRQCFDYVFSIGVLHHLPLPKAGFDSLLRILKRNGVISAWVYGREGNFLIRTVGSFFRENVTSRLPHAVLKAFCFPVAVVLHLVTSYLYKPFDLKGLLYGKYFIAIADFDFRNKFSIVFDHMVPPIAFYLSKDEFEDWFSSNKLKKVVISSRYDNSWRGTGTK
ncbi:methyltransferase domain-containing protein [Candidatus Woesearchaeota archaeon]|nr:methyltransferase domain-containing protein [Candidatus Woesearchaeota archaeon]